MNKQLRFISPGKWKILLPISTALLSLAAYPFFGGQVRMDEFFGIYEKKAMVSESRNGLRISSMVVTPDYLAAARLRGNPEPTREDLEKARSYYLDGIRILVRIKNEKAATGAGEVRGDLLYSSLEKGRGRFSQTLDYWQNGFKEKVLLENGSGKTLSAVNYHYLRRWELGNEETFLFIFPDSLEGHPLSVSDWKIRFKEFGLSTGNLELKLIRPPGLRVRI